MASLLGPISIHLKRLVLIHSSQPHINLLWEYGGETDTMIRGGKADTVICGGDKVWNFVLIYTMVELL